MLSGYLLKPQRSDPIPQIIEKAAVVVIGRYEYVISDRPVFELFLFFWFQCNCRSRKLFLPFFLKCSGKGGPATVQMTGGPVMEQDPIGYYIGIALVPGAQAEVHIVKMKTGEV